MHAHTRFFVARIRSLKTATSNLASSTAVIVGETLGYGRKDRAVQGREALRHAEEPDYAWECGVSFWGE